MTRNMTIRFLGVFIVFFIAGIFLILSLKEAMELQDVRRNFDTNVLIPTDDLASTLHKTFALKTFAASPEEGEKSSVHETLALLDRVCSYNENVLKIYRIERACERLRQKFEALPNMAATLDPERLGKEYEALHRKIVDLRKVYIESFENYIDERKKTLQATFYVSFFLAATTLTMLFLLLLEVNSLNRKLKLYLEEREDFQKKLAEANEELARYSEELETEVKKRTEEALEHLKKNPLTKLPNRLSFVEKISTSETASVAIFNIDRFQSYNDLFGSDVGDKIIKDYAAYLRQIIPYIYEIYHLQGDEFAIVEQNEKSSGTFLSMITQASKFAREFHFNDTNGEFILQISIGVAIDQKQPLVKADMALKHAKHSNESMVLYSDDLIKPHRYLENIMMTKELTSALKERRIVPWFQAIADTRTREVVKYEVLARLVGKDGKIYSPYQFIPLAKQIRLYSEITKIIFTKAMDTIERHGLHLSINLSADDIHHRPTRDFIIDRLAMSSYSDHVTFELLESEETENYEEIAAFIERIKRFGVKIAIDDFGSGYSNFARILKLKVDNLKIDGSFIKNIDKNPDSREFVEIIHNLAKNYNIETVAEFVSDESIYDTVRAIGITNIQGYYLHQPQPLEEILKQREIA